MRHFNTKTLINITCFLSIYSMSYGALYSKERKDKTIFIFATGPSLYDPIKKDIKRRGKYIYTRWSKDKNSSYAKERISSVGKLALRDHPNASVKTLEKLKLSSISETFKKNSGFDHIVFVISALGGVTEKGFYILGYEGEKIFGKEINEIFEMTRTTVELVLLTSNSYKYELPNKDNFFVFGASSLKGGGMKAEDFYNYLKNFHEPKNTFPITAEEFYNAYIQSKFKSKKTAWFSSYINCFANYWGLWKFETVKTIKSIKDNVWHQKGCSCLENK